MPRPQRSRLAVPETAARILLSEVPLPLPLGRVVFGAVRQVLQELRQKPKPGQFGAIAYGANGGPFELLRLSLPARAEARMAAAMLDQPWDQRPRLAPALRLARLRLNRSRAERQHVVVLANQPPASPRYVNLAATALTSARITAAVIFTDRAFLCGMALAEATPGGWWRCVDTRQALHESLVEALLNKEQS